MDEKREMKQERFRVKMEKRMSFCQGGGGGGGGNYGGGSKVDKDYGLIRRFRARFHSKKKREGKMPE